VIAEGRMTSMSAGKNPWQEEGMQEQGSIRPLVVQDWKLVNKNPNNGVQSKIYIPQEMR
jgi:hypothetical protein